MVRFGAKKVETSPPFLLEWICFVGLFVISYNPIQQYVQVNPVN